MTKLVSFSAGLDSTWIMYQLLCKTTANEAGFVRPAYFSMWNGGNANFMELLMSVAMVERMMDRHRAQTDHVTWSVLGESNFPGVIGDKHANDWAPLIQQGNVIQGLTKLMHRFIRKRHHSVAYLGWNKMDALENSMSFGDWSLEEYERLKKLYSEIMYFQDHPGRIPPLQTPAWDKDKREMWEELPENIRELIQVSDFSNYQFAYDREKRYLWVYSTPSAKSVFYRTLGFEPSVGWRITINDAYKRFWCSELGEVISTLGLTVPFPTRYKSVNKWYPQFTVTDETDRLEICSYNAVEWNSKAEHFEALREAEIKRSDDARARKNMDAADGEVASSGEVTTS